MSELLVPAAVYENLVMDGEETYFLVVTLDCNLQCRKFYKVVNDCAVFNFFYTVIQLFNYFAIA